MSLNGNSRIADKFVVRLPDGMRERIAKIASTNHRSMNSEIIGRLEDSINADDPKYTPIHPDQLSAEEMAIVMSVRDMAKGKRKALLTLLSSDQ